MRRYCFLSGRLETHHLWDRPNYRYLFPELLADVGSGHNIRVTGYQQAREMYRVSGPDELKSLGETEFVSGAVGIRLQPTAAIVRRCGEQFRRPPLRRQTRRTPKPTTLL